MPHGPTWAEAFDSLLAMLCAETGCTRDQLLDDQVHVVERPADAYANPAHRRFPPHPGWISIVSVGAGGVVAAQEWLLPELRPIFEGSGRDGMLQPIRMARLAEAAEQRGVVVYGPWPRFLGAAEHIKDVVAPEGYSVRILSGAESNELPGRDRFHNALGDPTGSARKTELAAVAEKNGNLVGVCGVSSDSDTMWQLGIDVVPAHRGRGVSSALASAAALATLNEGKVPYYCTTSANIVSMRTALAVGFRPAWVEVLARPADRAPMI